MSRLKTGDGCLPDLVSKIWRGRGERRARVRRARADQEQCRRLADRRSEQGPGAEWRVALVRWKRGLTDERH